MIQAPLPDKATDLLPVRGISATAAAVGISPLQMRTTMADEPTNRGSQDRSRINFYEGD